MKVHQKNNAKLAPLTALNRNAGHGDEIMPTSNMAAGRVIKRMAPGASGTRRLAERFGESLVCVRYRENPARGLRYTTVEIIVDQRPFNAPEDLVHVAYAETALRHKVKDAGGQWDRELKLWRIPRTAVRTLGLADRVVKRA